MSYALNNTFDVPRQIDPDGIAKPYWDATRDKRLLIQYCPVSRAYQFYPRVNSRATGRLNVEWREVSGKGKIFSYTIARVGAGAFRGKEPYAIVMVTLDVGVNIMSNLVNVHSDEIRIGMDVEPYWSPLADGYHLLMFQPAAKK